MAATGIACAQGVMGLTDEERERIRAATDVVALIGETVTLRQRGHEFWGCCPFHQERSPSFHVSSDTGLWHCFGCHKGGDIFNYVMEREQLDFMDAARYLADRAGIELSGGRGQSGPRRSRLHEVLAAAEEFYATMLLRGRGAGPSGARSYLAGRGFGADVCRRWRLGFAPGGETLLATLRGRGFTVAELDAADLCVDRGRRVADRFFDRVMFPIHDEAGRPVGFGGRVMGDGKPKYLNTRETAVFHKHRHLFALDRAKEAITARGVALVVEGYTDAMALHESGYPNAVAVLGTALSADHIRLLERYGATQIICMFDGDAAGQRAAELSLQHVDRTRADMRCVVLPDRLDPAEFLALRGADALASQLDASEPLVDFVLERRLAAYDLSVPGQRGAALADAARVLAPLKASPLLDGYATNLAFRLGREDVDAVRRVIRSSSVSGEGGGRRVGDGQGKSVPASSPGLSPLSGDDRQQIAAERELLSTLMAKPGLVRPHGERIASFAWADSRNEAMAWAMLATPEHATPAAMLQAATSVVAEAPQLLSYGRLADDATADTVSFLLDTIELYSIRRQVVRIRAAMRGSVGREDASGDVTGLFRKATELQRREGELARRLSART